jgi:hypothetical protein
LAPLGEVFAVSQSPIIVTNCEDESLEFMWVGEALGFLAVGQTPEVKAVGYAHSSQGIAQIE